tara:strand:- start:156 stop:1064 length:909 start_codon:yes stop_codon:yes gene_type:complete
MSPLDDLDTRLLVDLLRDRIRPQKSLGQHFLIDDKVISRAIELSSEFSETLNSTSHVLEIGPGPGSLSLAILRSGAKLTALEIDNQSFKHLNRVFEDLDDKLVIFNQDALIGHWPKDITHIISNLPYQISSPILEKIQNHHSINPISSIVLLVQDEFAERMAMSRGHDTRGPLGMSLWLDFDVRLDRKVPSSSFSPAPNVNSRLVILTPASRDELININRKLFRLLTKHCYTNRRRKIRTSLSKSPRRLNRINGWHKERWISAMKEIFNYPIIGLPDNWLDLRPEDLSPEEWTILTSTISSK